MAAVTGFLVFLRGDGGLPGEGRGSLTRGRSCRSLQVAQMVTGRFRGFLLSASD
jgi:hypothetical protein